MEGAKHVGAAGNMSQAQGTACRGPSCASPPGDIGGPRTATLRPVWSQVHHFLPG